MCVNINCANVEDAEYLKNDAAEVAAGIVEL